jgi:Leucine-rich repeat (LRR) protein
MIILAQQTYVPDDNFEQALINLGYDNVLDDYVLTANINTINLLNINNKNISDLTGIGDFFTLSHLYCGANNLQSLDLSNNSNLSYLSAAGNQLTSLDISQNYALNQLFCNSNQLTYLDLSANTSLSSIYCDDNLLISLDLRNNNNTNITTNSFYCNQNPNLTCIDVDNPSWSTTNWTHIDSWTSFSLDCNGTSIEDVKSTKYLVKIINTLGVEISELKPQRQNSLLFFIYNDGTVEKRIPQL